MKESRRAKAADRTLMQGTTPRLVAISPRYGGENLHGVDLRYSIKRDLSDFFISFHWLSHALLQQVCSFYTI